MARRKAQKKIAEYECLTRTTWPVEDENGKVEHNLFIPATEGTRAHSPNKGKSQYVESDSLLEVDQGTIVSKHFVPVNDIAEDDREDQLANPHKYIKDERDMAFIAELFVKTFNIRAVKGESKITPGKTVVVKSPKDVAIEMIKATDDFDEDAVVENGVDREREAAIKALMALGETDKDRRKKIGAILKDAEVKFFNGLSPEIMAGMVYDEGLYEGE
jgi:hypothetical protein